MAKDQDAQLAAAKQELVLAYQHANAALGRFLSLIDGVDVQSSLKYLLDGGVPAFAPVSHSNGSVGIKGSKKRPAETDDELDDDDDAASVGAKGKGKKKVKKEVDPNAPKRPASAFIIFQNAVRAEMKRENPEADHKTLAKEIGDKWKALSEEEKQPWSEMARESMARFMEERKTYELEHPDAKAKLAAINAAIKTGSKSSSAAAAGDKVGKKRGRPSNAEKAARAEANGEPEDAVVGEKKKSKKDKSGVPVTSKPQASPAKKPTSAPPIAESSSNESSDEESEEEESSDEVAAPAPPVVQRTKSSAPAAAGKKGAAEPSSSDDSEEEDSSSEEDAPKAVVAKPVSKKQKVEKKLKK